MGAPEGCGDGHGVAGAGGCASGRVPLCHARVCRSLRKGASCLGEQSGSLKHFLFTRVVGVSGPFRCPSLQNTLRDLGSPLPPEKKGPRST